MHLSRIHELLGTRAHEPDVIPTCRIAWALAFSEHTLKGYREISRASGVCDQVVKRLLPPEGETDPLELITCVRQGRASIHADELRGSVYAPVQDSGDPGTKHPSVSGSTTYLSPDQEEGCSSVSWTEEDLKTSSGLPGVFGTGVGEGYVGAVMQTLRPDADVWHQTGGWAWALAVLNRCSDTEVAMPELRSWTGLSDSGVRKMVRRWEEAEYVIGYRRATPGRPTVVRLMFKQWVLGDGDYRRTEHADAAYARHHAEAERHRQRMTDEGFRAKSIVRGEITDHDVPAEVVAQGEDAVYRHLAEAPSEPESAQEPPARPEVPSAPARLPLRRLEAPEAPVGPSAQEREMAEAFERQQAEWRRRHEERLARMSPQARLKEERALARRRRQADQQAA